ncbi:MAG TPA: primosomal protein N', partial [Armatimonadota bacterium]|nr:primosomal protein N' [Armatimonadota bacterium]
MDAREGAVINVIVDQPGRGLDRAFSYLPPKSAPERIEIGSYVLVPFGRRQLPGFVVGSTDEQPEFALKRIAGPLLDDPVFNERQLAEAEWLAEEYDATLGDALRCYLPPGSTRNIRRRAVMLTDAPLATIRQMIGGRSRKQLEVVEALRAAEGEMSLDALKSKLGSDPTSALRSLEDKRIAAIRRDLTPPSAQLKVQRFASLAQSREAVEAEAIARAIRAPRQAETLRRLLVDQVPVKASELNASAVNALARDGVITVEELAVRRAPEEAGLGEEARVAPPPTPEQAEALEVVGQTFDAGGGEVLLHGVTGSGKTEVYIQAIHRVLDRGRTAIVMVPEISLTPQLLGRFRARFGDQLAVMHSAISAGERFDEWHRAKTGDAQIVVGARSAVFAPLQNLGLIIIDEEHERAYKQDRPPRYDARTVASQRCRAEGAVLLLGSATPSIETYWTFVEGHHGRRIVDLPRRIDDRPLPGVELIDMRAEAKLGRTGTFSAELAAALTDCLDVGNQAILFLNRRGFSTFVMCRECGFALGCEDCSVSMTYHYGDKAMQCHHCDRRERVPDICPSCGGTDIGFHGLGTERVADQVEREFPDARVCRMDRDTTSTKGAHGTILRQFASRQCNVLVGTQMI